jgi:hypothetical protein
MSAQPTSKSTCNESIPEQSWIEREWARFQAWAAARRPDGLPAPLLTEAAQKVLKQQVEGDRVTDDHR